MSGMFIFELKSAFIVPRMHYQEDMSYHREDFRQKQPAREYESCNFKECEFSGVDLTGVKFINCSFITCNFSLAVVEQTLFHEVVFKECKLLGLRFDGCQQLGFSVTFDSCQLDHACFYNQKLKKTLFRNCQMREVDFTGSDLSGSVFAECDLFRAIFDSTILKRADFRTAVNYIIDPEQNVLTRARFSQEGVGGLLARHNIDIE